MNICFIRLAHCKCESYSTVVAHQISKTARDRRKISSPFYDEVARYPKIAQNEDLDNQATIWGVCKPIASLHYSNAACLYSYNC